MLLGGIAWLITACVRIAAANLAMCSGVSRSTPFGASPMPSKTGSGEWHIEQRVETTLTTSAGALGRLAIATAAGGAGPRPSTVRMPGEAAMQTQNAAQIATAATNQAHHGAL